MDNQTIKLISLIFNVKRAIFQNLKKNKGLDILSYLQAETLHFIGQKKQPIASEVADYLCITKPSATNLIDTLEKNKLVYRIKSKQDKRNTYLKISTKGKKLVVSTFKKFELLFHSD